MALDDLDSQFSGTYTSSVGLGGGGGDGFGSSSQGESQSTSEPVSVESRQTDWGLLQSQLLSALGDQQYKWAMDKYARGEGVTDQTIANFMEMSGKGKGLADTLLTQYKDQFAPLMSKYIADAGSYASEGRQKFMAGEAMSTVAQADQAAMNEMERKLGGFGVNVNSGRYQDMLLSARTADAAARAGAGTKAAQDTADRGRAMEEKAIAMGQQLPGQAMNAVNTAYAGLTGAENAILGLMNAGAKLTESAAPFYNAAVGANKIPPTGAQSQSTSRQQAESRTPGPQGGGGGGGGSKGGGQPKQQGGPKEQQPKQPQQPKGQGEGKGEGDGKGGGKGPGGAGSADAKAVGGIGSSGSSGYGKEIKIPQTSKEEEDPGAGTGAADLSGYSGPIGYVDSSGTVYPEFSPGVARDEAGNLYGSDTPQWGGEQAANWTLPQLGERGYNTDPASAGGDNPQLGFPGGTMPTFPETSWSDAFANPAPGSYDPYSSFDQGMFPGGDSGELPMNAGATSGQGYDPWGGQNFSDWGDDTGSDWGDESGGGWDESGFEDTNWGDESGGGVDESGFEDTNWGDESGGGWDESGFEDTNWGGQQQTPDDIYNAGEDFSNWYDDQQQYQDYPDEYQASESYPDEYQNYGGEYDVGGGESYQGYDESGFSGGWDEYARGGRVRPRPEQRPRPRPSAGRGVLPTTGGPVPRSASPSRGGKTDDISARLNAGEYVIPKDVVAHQGTKFFTDLIAKSRKLRTGMAGAKPGPTMKRALPPGRPTFRSRPLPPR